MYEANTIVKPTLASGVLECLGREWKGDNFSDFRVMVDGAEFFCHKFILSACSTFFKGLLRGDFKEKQEGCVELNNMSKETFEVIINAMYTGVDGVRLDNVLAVWQATHMLDIPFLIHECENFVKENMSLENYIQFYNIAKHLNSETVVKFSVKFMKENFDHFSETETFLELPFPVLLSLVEDDDLKVKSENIVLEAILDWVTNGNSELRQIKIWDYKETETETTTSELALVGKVEDVEWSLESELDSNVEPGNNVDSSLQPQNLANTVDKMEMIQVHTHLTDSKSSSGESDTESETRNKQLVELLSAARSFLASRRFLEELLAHPCIRSCAEAHSIIYEALLYQWRSVAYSSTLVIPYRKHSGKRNAVVFINLGQLNIFDLNTESTCQIKLDTNLELDTSFPSCLASSGSNLCFFYLSRETTCEFDVKREPSHRHSCCNKNIAILDDNKKLTTLGKGCGESRTHLISLNNVFANISSYTFKREKLEKNISNFVEFAWDTGYDSVCVFQDTVLIFYNCYGCEPVCCKVYCCNFYTKTTKKLYIDGPGLNVVNFQKGKEVFIIQRDGALRSVKMGTNSRVKFKLVTQLWKNCEWDLTGAVFYKRELILFCSTKPEEVDSSLLKTVPGICDRIKVVEIESQSCIVPLVVPEAWVTPHSIDT
ncbi:uncharacterized protein LOC131933512 [Physella acuta]|uniref:uncharacterized protein LOC131933512 n=1 Tax=Physella acuta TaxID=109671 RepID=UPI0027DABE70|nr:uncharacterized protein LOC131933512 [Physella acuta]